MCVPSLFLVYVGYLKSAISLDTTSWRAEDYVEELTERATGQNERVEAKLRKKYPPIFSPNTYQMKPCTVKDKVGNLMLWYIPGCLTVPRSVSFLVL